MAKLVTSRVRIECNVTGQKFSVGYQTSSVEIADNARFSVFMAREISRIIVKAIDDQRYRGTWKPLTEEYLEYKRKAGLKLKIWEASSTLKLSVGYDVAKNLITIGVRESAKYKNGPEILDVAKWMEFGTRKMPDRPLFRPVIRYVRSNIQFFYKRYENDREFRGRQLDSLNWSHRDLMDLVDRYSLRTRSKSKGGSNEI